MSYINKYSARFNFLCKNKHIYLINMQIAFGFDTLPKDYLKINFFMICCC